VLRVGAQLVERNAAARGFSLPPRLPGAIARPHLPSPLPGRLYSTQTKSPPSGNGWGTPWVLGAGQTEQPGDYQARS